MIRMVYTRKVGWTIGLVWAAIGVAIIKTTLPDPASYFFGLAILWVGILFISVTEIAHYAFLSVGGY